MEHSVETTATPVVSIVIPAYNHAAYLAETIESVFRQTYRQWELIVIDDGSTDETPAIIQRYRDPRIRTFRHDNRGLSATLNRGVSLARGRYFAFLPSDDVYEPDKLTVQVEVLEKNPTVGIVFSRQTVIDAQGEPTAEKQVQSWFEVSFTTKEEIFPALFERDFLSTPTHLLRMECFARVGLFDESLVTTQDYDLWVRILRYYDIRLLSQSLVRMRWHEHNQTRHVTPQTEQERATVLLKAFRALSIEEIFPSLAGIHKQEYPEAFAQAYLTLARYTLRSGLATMIPVARLYLTQALACRRGLLVPQELQPLLEASTGLQKMNLPIVGEVDEKNTVPPLALMAGSEEIPVGIIPSERIHVVIEVKTLENGGVEQVVFSMVTGLPHSVFRFLIVCVEQGGMTAERCRQNGIPVEILSGDKEAVYREILRRFQADLVVTHYSSFGSPIAAQLGIPVISFVHGLYAWLHGGLLGEMGTWDQYVSRYVAVSHDIASYLTRRFHLAQEKICVIPNGVEIVSKQKAEISTNRTHWGLSPDDYVFLHVAAISPAKGYFALLEALRQIADECPTVKVLSVGPTLDEEYQHRVLEKRRQLQLEERFLFAGFQPDVTPFYGLADAFVLPSVLEGFGLVKLEAMLHGLPLILTRVGDSARLIEDGDIGLLVPDVYEDLCDISVERIHELLADENPPNAPALAEAMMAFVRHPDQWREAGRRGREKILSRFTREQALKSYEALFIREVGLAQKRRGDGVLRRENRLLREQTVLWARVVDEKERAIREKNGQFLELDKRLHETALTIQEKDRVLHEQERRLADLTQLAERQHRQIDMLQQATAQQLQELQRVSFAIFDRLDLTKRVRALQNRALWRVRRHTPQPVKRIGKMIRSYFQTRRLRRGSSIGGFSPALSNPALIVEGGNDAYQQSLMSLGRDFARAVSDNVLRKADEILAQGPYLGVVLYPPTIKWTERLFQRPHQLLRALAAQGYLCIFGSPDATADEVNGFRQIEERLFLCSEIGVFQAFEGVNLILWLSRPDQRVVSDFFPQALVVYDIIDALEVFPQYCDAFLRDHNSLLRRADMVTITAEELLTTARKIRGDALLVPNGVCLEDFVKSAGDKIPVDMEPLLASGRPIVGFYGAIAPWLDYALIDYAAQQCPDLSFVLIGPDHEGGAGCVTPRPNLHWLGPKAYSVLPAYASRFDVATIPFQMNDITRAVSPVKLFEYMALGRPIVSTAIPECRRYQSVLIAEDPQAYVQQLRKALVFARDPAYTARLTEEAAENTWEQRARSCISRLQSLQRRSGIPTQY